MKNLFGLLFGTSVWRMPMAQFSVGQVLTAAELNAAFSAGTTLIGADATGAADSTAIIQAAVNAAVQNGTQLDIPPGTFKLSAAISIPFGFGWIIRGYARGGTTLVQTAANTPIFSFATGQGGTGPYDWAITDLTLKMATPQPITNTHGSGILFTNSANTYFNFQVSRCTFVNCYQGIAEDPGAQATVWGGSFRDNTYGSTNSGGFLNLAYGNTGQPNIEVDGLYVTATNIDATESIINVANNDSGWYNHIEVNGVSNGSPLMTLSGAGAIGTVKVEVANYGAGQFAFVFPNGHWSIGAIAMDTMTINAPGGAAYAIDANGGGGSTTLDIGQVNLTFNGAIVGNFYLVNSGAAPNYSVRFRSAPQGLLGVAGAYLTQVPAAVSSDGVSVDDWQQPRLSGDMGNANSSWSVGQPTIVQYNSHLSAARTVTLTDSATNTNDTNLYNGIQVSVVRNEPATVSAFALTVKDAAGTTIGSIPASSNGRVSFMWKRAIGAWSLTEYMAWTGNAP